MLILPLLALLELPKLYPPIFPLLFSPKFTPQLNAELFCPKFTPPGFPLITLSLPKLKLPGSDASSVTSIIFL